MTELKFHVEPDAWLPVAELLTMFHPANSQTRNAEEMGAIKRHLLDEGFTAEMIVVNPWNRKIVSGHGRTQAAHELGHTGFLPVVYREYTSEAEHRRAMLRWNLARGHQDEAKQAAEFAALLAEFEQGDLAADFGQTEGEFEALLKEFGLGDEPAEDPGPQVDRAAELQEKWKTEPGQMWSLDSGKGHAHRLICGDCTDKAVVERVMGGERAALCHADPPYGMGKENDGIANDNLYRERLDTFQMQWWKTCRPSLTDNASAYIWGTDEDLWRLWFVGGLKDSERFTFRNEIVWDKGNVQGMASDSHRMYPTGSERAIFFMLGEQGFNINADNYWDGWEPIRAYLEGEALRLGIGNAELLKVCGVGSMYSHWFTKSQWIFIPEEHYRKLQAAAKGDGFKRDYDGFKRDYDTLKRDFYATRAYFDNAHAKMTDIWDFPLVLGDDRHGHATPKPVQMMERIVKSSTAAGAVVYVPFGGTLPELIACEQLGRKCRAVEISAAYVGVTLERFHQMTGATPELLP